jgi:hypothetical protein
MPGLMTAPAARLIELRYGDHENQDSAQYESPNRRCAAGHACACPEPRAIAHPADSAAGTAACGASRPRRAAAYAAGRRPRALGSVLDAPRQPDGVLAHRGRPRVWRPAIPRVGALLLFLALGETRVERERAPVLIARLDYRHAGSLELVAEDGRVLDALGPKLVELHGLPARGTQALHKQGLLVITWVRRAGGTRLHASMMPQQARRHARSASLGEG